MKWPPALFFLSAFAAFFACASAQAAPVIETDVCVYGGTSGGVTAAVQAARLGKSVSFAVFGQHVGGMTSGGLGATDTGGNGTDYIQGMSREFYTRIATSYGGTGARFNFEPKVAEAVFNTMLSEAGVIRRNGQHLTSVSKFGQRIVQITMDDGTIYRAKMFIDASYEGDLMAMAGVTWTIGRESTAQYGESLNGIRASTPAHQFSVDVDPYITPGVPASGLLPFIQPGNGGTPGTADSRVQAYNYRMCLTKTVANRIPIAAPAGYNEATYELLGRLFDKRIALGQTPALSNFMNISGMPGGKTDINNNGAFSTDFIGMADTYAGATYAQRAVIEQQHRDYIQGFLYYLGHSSRVNAEVRNEMLQYGFCADEFTDNGGFGALYVREARRMVSDYVMLQQNCQGSRVAADPIGLGSYTMDSHNCQRIVNASGFVRNEGDVQSASHIYGISYRSIIPKGGECENLLVPWAVSASHMGFGSIRMEPVFMILGQSAATAAAFAIDDDVAVQQLSYARLALQLLADGQALGNTTTSTADETIVDNADGTGVTITGNWDSSTSSTGFFGANYFHDQSSDKGTKSVRFTPNLPVDGQYDVYLRWTTNANRSTNVPVDVISNSGTQTFTVNQQNNNGTWNLLQRATFTAGTGGSVLVRTTGTTTGTYVIADAARWVLVGTPPPQPPVQIVASDAITREGTSDAARFTLIRAGADAANALIVQYTLSGAAQSSDYSALSGSATFAAGATTTTITVQAANDMLAEGTETVTATIQPGAGYIAGALDSATVRILDRPIDEWRHAHFTAAELDDTAVSGDTADADLDGLRNIEEYAYGLDPRAGNRALLAAPSVVANRLTLTYPQSRAATDVTLVAEGSLDLSTWSTANVEEVSRTDGGDVEWVTVQLTTPVTGAQRGFLRVRVAR